MSATTSFAHAVLKLNGQFIIVNSIALKLRKFQCHFYEIRREIIISIVCALSTHIHRNISIGWDRIIILLL